MVVDYEEIFSKANKFEKSWKAFKESKFYGQVVNKTLEVDTNTNRLIQFNLDYGDRIRPAIVSLHAYTSVFKVFHMDEKTDAF